MYTFISAEDYLEEAKCEKAGKVYVKPKKKKRKPKPAEVNQAKTSEDIPLEDLPVDIGRLDLRVGKIVWAQNHPLVPDSHYLQYIHIDSSILTKVVSELVEHYKKEDLKDERDTVVLCNLRPPNIYGLMSEGLVLCAVKDGKAELLTAPTGAQANDKIYVSGFPRRPDQPYMKPHKMIYETVSQDLRVNDQKQVVYKGIPLQVEGREGYITTQLLADCPVKCL